MPEEPRPKLNHRVLFLALCMAMFVFAASGQALAAALAPLSAEFNRNLAQRSFLLLFFPLGFIFSTLLSGYLSDRWGQRIFILLGIVLLGAGLSLAAVGWTWGILCVGLFFIGVSGGFVESPVTVVVSDVFIERRAQALNVSQMFFNLGAVTGPLFMSVALKTGKGWRPGFGAVVPIVAAVFILSYFSLPRQGGTPKEKTTHQTAKPGNRTVLVMASITLFLYVGGEMTVATWCSNYVENVFAVPSSRAALVVSGFWFSMMIGRGIYAAVVNRFGYLPLILTSAILSVLAVVGAALVPWAGVAAGLCCLVGFLLGGSWPSIMGYVAHRSPGRTGSSFGIVVSAGALGMLLVPPLAGVIAEHSTYGLRAGILVGAFSLLAEAGMIIALWVQETRERRS